MNQDIIIKEREIKQQLIDIINKADLPAFLLQYIFKELYEQLENLVEQQYNEAQLKLLKNKVNETKDKNNNNKKEDNLC